jgi:mannose-1-phosphate guanylyltransferase/mannose-6-phosphate isomerase
MGLKNIIAEAMNDAVHVTDMSRAQNVKNVVNVFKRNKATQATTFSKHHRPCGWFEILALGDQFQVKRT